jgi:hypothetical protein
MNKNFKFTVLNTLKLGYQGLDFVLNSALWIYL